MIKQVINLKGMSAFSLNNKKKSNIFVSETGGYCGAAILTGSCHVARRTRDSKPLFAIYDSKKLYTLYTGGYQ